MKVGSILQQETGKTVMDKKRRLTGTRAGTAVMVVSTGGLETALKVCQWFPAADLHVPSRLEPELENILERKESSAGSPEDGNCTNSTGGSKTEILKTREKVHFFAERPGSLVGRIAANYSNLVMVMSTAIAVRLLAPFIKGKTEDPAVVVLDDRARFAISLLSGHLGGANDLANELAGYIGAEPVITTATDSREIAAVDLLASRLGWFLEGAERVKEISSQQLQGKPALLYSRYNIRIKVPPGSEYVVVNEERELHGLAWSDENKDNSPGERDSKKSSSRYAGVVLVTSSTSLPETPYGLPRAILRPADLVAGIGCRRGTPSANILEALENAITCAGRVVPSLSTIATVPEKQEEPGLKEAASSLNVPVLICDKEELASIEHLFPSSPLVKKQVGVGAVAEPCAYLGSGGGELITSRMVYNGVTVSLAEKTLDCDFPI